MGIRGLVPGPRLLNQALRKVVVANYFSKGQNAVIVFEMIRAPALPICSHAVVSIVEEEPKIPGIGSILADTLYQLRFVPCMDNDQVSAIKGQIEVKLIRCVAVAGQVGVSCLKPADRLIPVGGYEILDTPGILRFINMDIVPLLDKLGGNAPQKVSIAVVPVRNQGMVKHNDTHLISPYSFGVERVRADTAFSDCSYPMLTHVLMPLAIFISLPVFYHFASSVYGSRWLLCFYR